MQFSHSAHFAPCLPKQLQSALGGWAGILVDLCGADGMGAGGGSINH